MAYETLGMREKAKRQGVDGGSCHDRPTGRGAMWEHTFRIVRKYDAKIKGT